MLISRLRKAVGRDGFPIKRCGKQRKKHQATGPRGLVFKRCSPSQEFATTSGQLNATKYSRSTGRNSSLEFCYQNIYISIHTPQNVPSICDAMPETFLACCALAYCRVHLRVYFNQYTLLTGTLFPCPEYASNTRVFTYCQPH